MKCSKTTQQDRKMAIIIAATTLGLAMARKANEGLLSWYDRGLETFQLLSATL